MKFYNIQQQNRCSYHANGQWTCTAPATEPFEGANTASSGNGVTVVTRSGQTVIKPGESRSMSLSVLSGLKSVSIPANELVRLTLTLRVNNASNINAIIAKIIKANMPPEMIKAGVQLDAGFQTLNMYSAVSFTFKLAKPLTMPIPALYRQVVSIPLVLSKKCPGSILKSLLSSGITIQALPKNATSNFTEVPNEVVDEITSTVNAMMKPDKELQKEADAWFSRANAIDCALIDGSYRVDMKYVLEGDFGESYPDDRTPMDPSRAPENVRSGKEGFMAQAKALSAEDIITLAKIYAPSWMKM